MPTLSHPSIATDKRLVNLTALDANLGETAIVITNTNGRDYYTCVVDGEGRVRYSSLAQSCIEESLSVVLMLVWEDVVAMRRDWGIDEEEEDEESDTDEEELIYEEEDGYEDGDEEESDEEEKIDDGAKVDSDEEMDEEGDKETDEHKNIEGHDEMDLD